jgi:ectoine hydroxylase-related dioxygenase (phytanoyl-CoA dioxygenase family)
MFDIDLAQDDHRLADTYTRHGVVHVRALLDEAETAQIRDTFMEQVERDRSIGHDDHLADHDVLARYPRFVHPHRHTHLPVGRLARHWMLEPRIIERVTAMIGPALAAQSMFYFKPPTARGQAIHQDNLFLQAYPETCIAAWIAIDDCDADNGGLQVVPGSHRYRLICPEEADTEESFTTAAIPLPDDMAAVQIEMRAGDALFFHGSTAHGSGPNHTTDRFRRSLIFHYVPRSSTEIAAFYHPLLTPEGDETVVAAAIDGGACGEGWQPSRPH